MRSFFIRLGVVAAMCCLLPVTLNAQGDNAQILTQGESMKGEAWISEDGLFVAYVGDKNQEAECLVDLAPNDSEIFLLDVVAATTKRLTNNDVEDIAPSVSADGNRVAYMHRAGVESDAYSVLVHDSIFEDTFDIPFSTGDSQTPSQTVSQTRPMISGNGDSVVYEEGGDIYIAQVDAGPGENPVNLTNSPSVDDSFPSISSNGSKIVFASTGDYLGTNPTGDLEIFSITSTGNNLQQITRNEVNDLHPMMSGNGLFIAFERELNGQFGAQFDVFVVAADGSSFETNLTNSTTRDERYPSLSFDGEVIGFEDRADELAQYAKINRDGTGLSMLTSVQSEPIDRASVILTRGGETAIFSSKNGDLGCRQVFIVGDAPNVAPLANGGGDQEVGVGDTVQLDATGSSDPNGDTLIYVWKIVSKPTGSTASLDDPTSATPTFVADLAGEYLVDLTINDGREGEDGDKVNIVATEGGGGGSSDPGSSAGTIEEALDVNANQVIDDDEMIEAISYWVLGTAIPSTDNLTVGDDKILSLIELWILGAPF